MKIDESCINHNALREIDKTIEDMYDLTCENQGDNIRIATIGQIRKRTLDDFKPGLMVPGKLLPKTIQGGVILVKSFYTLRG